MTTSWHLVVQLWWFLHSCLIIMPPFLYWKPTYVTSLAFVASTFCSHSCLNLDTYRVSCELHGTYIWGASKMLAFFISACGDVFSYFIFLWPHCPVTPIIQNQNENAGRILILKSNKLLRKNKLKPFPTLLFRKDAEFCLQHSIFSN